MIMTDDIGGQWAGNGRHKKRSATGIAVDIEVAQGHRYPYV